jgi:hypothetical protein
LVKSPKSLNKRTLTSIIQDQVQGLSILEGLELLIDTPDVFSIGLSLPRKHRDSDSGDGSSGMILGTVDVARRPSDLSTF